MHGTPPPAALLPATIGGVSRPQFIAIVASLMALNALAIDIMLPAFPNISQSLGLTDPNLVQYVLLSYIIGFGGAQLFFGPLAARSGPRPPLFVGPALSALCALAGRPSRRASPYLAAARICRAWEPPAPGCSPSSVVRDPLPAAAWPRPCRLAGHGLPGGADVCAAAGPTAPPGGRLAFCSSCPGLGVGGPSGLTGLCVSSAAPLAGAPGLVLLAACPPPPAFADRCLPTAPSQPVLPPGAALLFRLAVRVL